MTEPWTEDAPILYHLHFQVLFLYEITLRLRDCACFYCLQCIIYRRRNMRLQCRHLMYSFRHHMLLSQWVCRSFILIQSSLYCDLTWLMLWQIFWFVRAILPAADSLTLYVNIFTVGEYSAPHEIKQKHIYIYIRCETILRLLVRTRVVKHAAVISWYDLEKCWWLSLMFDLPTHEWRKKINYLYQVLAKITMVKETWSLVGKNDTLLTKQLI